MKWHVVTAVLLIASVIGGCADEPLLGEAQRDCRSRGVDPGSAAYAPCVKQSLDALNAYWHARGGPNGPNRPSEMSCRDRAAIASVIGERE